MELLIIYYFLLGLQQREIRQILANTRKHNIFICERTLKRHLKRLNLYRRQGYSSLRTVNNFLQRQLQGSGQLHGYKWMHRRCIQSGLTVTQKTVRTLLQYLDPVGVSLRKINRLRRRQYRNSGPNYLWHVDSYDKLKPYGICINGCIDGFSRKIIWLKASYTSNKPQVIGGYYIQAIMKLMGCPRTVRTDMGTENVYLENMQIYLRHMSEVDVPNSPFLYGTSQSNQRIEGWWSILRKHSSQFWMNLFQTLRDDGYYDGTFIDKSLIQFCFMEIIQNELKLVVTEWNSHPIRKSRNGVLPCGKPMILYNIPQLYNTEDYIVNVREEFILNCAEECTYIEYPCDKDVFELCEIFISENELTKSEDPYDAVNLYIFLRREIKALLMP